MGKVKNIIIFILSVVVAYLCGLFTIVFTLLDAMNNMKKDNRHRERVSYRSMHERADD